MSRRNFVGGATAAAMVLACGGAMSLLAAPASAEITKVGNTDAQALRFLEELELMQADFFTRVTASAAFEGMEERERSIFATIAEQDRRQAEWFRLARRRFGISEYGRFYTPNASQSRPGRQFMFSAKAFGTRPELLPLAISLKNTGVATFHGVVGRAEKGDIAQALAALAGIQGRHAAALREMAGQDPFTGAFEEAITPNAAARRLARYGFRGDSML
jgi:hypothetical protein